MTTFNWPSLIGTPQNADNAAVTITFAAQTGGRRIELVNVVAAYDAKPSVPKLLTVTRGASTKLVEVPITEAGPAPLNLEGFMSGPNEALTVVLAASGTGGTKGYLSACARVV